MHMEAKQEINIDLSEEVAQGSYVNLAIITHSASEFIYDFVRMMPGIPKPKVQSRMIMTPEHAKRFCAALKENLDRYEAHFGTIKINDMGVPPIPMNFGGKGAAQA
ncbi:MAG: DUF3467 domain-containing protein [Bacteroidetes bacterium]|nr:DUF3467 domain-containing protein [Bacteroidota bacterium]